MRNLIISAFVLVFGLAGFVPEAEARRLGSGSSLGMQRQATPPASPPRQPAAAPATARPAQPAAASSGRSWLGPVAGLAAGLGLAALFSHLGLGEEFGSFILIALFALAAFLLFRRFASRSRPAASAPMQFATQGAGAAHPSSAWQAATGGGAPAPQDDVQDARPREQGAGALPDGFDADAFVRQAKVQFIRLQAAHDARDLEDIRQYTTPEIFAEVRMQLTEAGSDPCHTEVVDLSAEVIEVAEEGGQYIVSVHFHGLIREQRDTAPASFSEIWHLTKPRDGNRGWLIAGIQQLN